MAPNRVALAGLIPVGFQTMSLANSTAIAINSTCKNASALFISVETNNCRFRDDGTAPTLTTGVLLEIGEYFLEGFTNAHNSTTAVFARFQRSTGTSKVSFMAYRIAGGEK
jgi:hypothetical protein